MRRVLFVCHGNICRSPMAEFVMKALVREAGREAEFEIASAAVSREEIGNGLYPPARRELQRRGVPCEGHMARQITRRDLEHYDRIVYMDASNARYLGRLFPGVRGKWEPLLGRDVADPWYTGDFARTWEDVLAGCRRLLEEL